MDENIKLDTKSNTPRKRVRERNISTFPWEVVLFGIFLSGSFLLPTYGQQVIITINGGWSPWSTVSSSCNATCGGGVMVKIRSCTNPTPQGMDAQGCEGPANQTFVCNTEPCDMQWSGWSNCSAACGRGMRMRSTRCAKEKDGPLFDCEGEDYFTHTEACNTWNKKTCPSPCEGYECMEFGACIDKSTEEDPISECECQLGKIFSDDGLSCEDPPPPTTTPRPIPTLAPAVKSVTTGITTTASTLLIIFTGITLFLFAALRIYDPARVIQMNMEISLICAHLLLVFPKDPAQVAMCRMISIMLHIFFTTCFAFMFLESLHTYSLVAYVVKRNGLLTRTQNVLTGWGIGIGVTMIVASLEFNNYGGDYHCWLDMGSAVMLGQYVPIVIFVILTLTMIEAAGAAEYRKLPGIDQKQQTSAKIMQRSNLIIMPMVFASFCMGTLAEYEQNVGMYGTVTIINGVLGGCIFFFHCTGNEQVRAKLLMIYKKVIKKEKF